MNSLENIKVSLDSNTNLTKEVKDKIYSLVEKLDSKIKGINFDRLNKNLKTVKLGRIGVFERKGSYEYDVLENKILLSKKANGNYDIDHIFMKAILEMTTSTGKYTGFSSDDRLRVLNLAYTEILANYIIGNEGDSDLEEEMLITNLLSHIVGKDTLFNAYFSNNGDIIIETMKDSEVGLL